MFTFLHALILGIVEGITEFLPISSTGHLILTSHLLHIPSTDFLKSFEIMIQLGAILAIVVLYWKTLLLDKTMWLKLGIAFLPTAAVVLVLYKIIKQYLLGNTQVVLWALLLGGIGLIVFELLHREPHNATNEKVDSISYKHSFLIGLAQVVALIPGVSRSAVTSVMGMFLGYARRTAVEFSFLLAVPTLVAATGYDALKNYQLFTFDNLGLLAVGFVISFVVALFAVRFLLKFIQKNTLCHLGFTEF
jgi:undecaprenyl-diphosphatase